MYTVVHAVVRSLAVDEDSVLYAVQSELPPSPPTEQKMVWLPDPLGTPDPFDEPHAEATANTRESDTNMQGLIDVAFAWSPSARVSEARSDGADVTVLESSLVGALGRVVVTDTYAFWLKGADYLVGAPIHGRTRCPARAP
jgi:hypothetical protein